MNCRLIQFPCLLLLLVTRAEAGLSGWDETQLQLLPSCSLPLRWDNVEGPPYWVAGNKPERQFGRGLHLICLQPGEHVTLRGEANSWLRLVGETKTLNPDDLEISISTDARLFLAAAAVKTVDPYALLVQLPGSADAVVRLARSRDASSPIVFAAFFSRAEPLATIVPYRDAVRLPGKSVRIRRDDEAGSTRAWLINPERPAELSIEGPVRLELEALFPFSAGESSQPLILRMAIDGEEPAPLLMTMTLDARHQTRVNHELKLASHRLRGFLVVPPGPHRVRLETVAPIYVAVHRQSPRSFLLPGLNAPGSGGFGKTGLPGEGVDVLGETALPGLEQEGWRLACDNHCRDAGAQAADWFNRLGVAKPAYPVIRQTAETMWRERTLYREILPSHLPADQHLRNALFLPGRLAALFEPKGAVAVANPTLDEVHARFVEGHFVQIPPRLSSGLLYELPPRSFESRLRLAVVSSGSAPARLLVQFDRDTALRVILDSAPCVGAPAFAASEALAALRVLEQRANLPTTANAGNRFELDMPHAVLEPGVIEIPLAKSVRRLRLHLEEGSAPVLASVACRVAKAFEFGETAYVGMLSEAEPAEVLRVLAQAPASSEPALGILSHIQNHLLPLSRLLRAHSNDFTRTINPGSLSKPAALNRPMPGRAVGQSGSDPKQPSPLPAGKVAATANAARDLEQAGRNFEALELWNELFWGTTAAQRTEAALGLLRCLSTHGEEFLAGQYARYALLTASDGTPQPAVDLLEDHALRMNDPDQLEQLRAFLFTRCPCAAHGKALVEALALNGRDEEVLALGLALPAEQQPLECMLPAAVRLNRWQTFDRLLGTAVSAKAPYQDGVEAKCFWRAQKRLAFYQFSEAAREFEQAGEKGREMAAALGEGLRIREGLGSENPRERFEALLAWEKWQGNQPGAKSWVAAHDVEIHSPATEMLFNCELNQFSSSARAEPGKSVRVRFLGPLRLRVEARPLLRVPFKEPVDDWLEISEYGITNRTPILQCAPNPSLQLVAGANELVGVKTSAEVEFGPGWHELEVALAKSAGVIRVLQEVPLLPLRVLPTLNARRMNLVLQGKGDSGASISRVRAANPDAGPWWVAESVARSGPARSEPELGPVAGNELPHVPATLNEVEKFRLALRMPNAIHPLPGTNSPVWAALPPTEQWLAACRGGRRQDFTNWTALPDSVRTGSWKASGRIQELLDSGLPSDALQRLATLLEIAEFSPSWREPAQCEAEVLAGGTNCPPGGKKILARLERDRTWVMLPVSPLSAGLRPVQTASDAPQDLSARLRRALLPPASTNHYTLSAQSVFTASMRLHEPARIQLRAELVRAGFSPWTPLSLSAQVDDLEVRHLRLAPPRLEATMDLSIPAGQHLVRIWIEDPVVNQLVRISLAESPGATNALWSRSMAEAAAEKRYFHAATVDQPLRFSWTGPAVLRVDEWREGQILSRVLQVKPDSAEYRIREDTRPYQDSGDAVVSSEQIIEIPPAPGRTESFYQVFVRQTQTNLPSLRTAWTMREPEEVPPPKLQLREYKPPALQLHDYYTPGGQEDGTWTPGLLLAHRRPFELSPDLDSVENEFIEANAAYRKSNAGQTLWFKTKALARVHRPGDLTFGLSEEIEGRPEASLFRWTWLGEAFVGTTGPDQQDVEGSLATEFVIDRPVRLNRKQILIPFAGLFGRYFTLDSDDVAAYTYIDQDLYTSFRNEHRWGALVGSRYEYRPWLDTILEAAAGLQSNENFGPDNLGMRFSWTQLAGPFHGEAAYQFRYFLDDADRSSDYFLQGVSVAAYYEHWLGGRHRLEIGAQYRHDWPDAGDSYFLVFRLDLSGGRRYRDYSPRETVFREARSRRIPAAYNNSFEPWLPRADLP